MWDTVVEGFGVRVRKSGRRVYVARYRTAGGRQRWITLGPHGKLTVQDARKLAREKLTAAIGGDDPARDRDEARKQLTVAQTIDRFIAERLGTYAASEQATRKAQLKWWSEQLGAVPLAELSVGDLKKARAKLENTPVTWGDNTSKQRSPSTVNRYMAAISRVLRLALSEGWIDENVARRLERKREPSGRIEYLEDQAQIKALLDACKADAQPLLHPLVLLALATGARRGELLKLEWQDVRLGAGTVTFKQTKNRSDRTVPVAGGALSELKQLSKVRQIGDARVFPLSVPALQTAWKRATAAAKLDGFRFHSLRHTAGSWLLMSGADIREVAEILGHKTLAMAQRYSHLAQPHLTKKAEAAAKKMGI